MTAERTIGAAHLTPLCRRMTLMIDILSGKVPHGKPSC